MSLNKPIWKLRDWIDFKKLDWHSLSLNSNAIEILEKTKIKLIGIIYLEIQMQLKF